MKFSFLVRSFFIRFIRPIFTNWNAFLAFRFLAFDCCSIFRNYTNYGTTSLRYQPILSYKMPNFSTTLVEFQKLKKILLDGNLRISQRPRYPVTVSSIKYIVTTKSIPTRGFRVTRVNYLPSDIAIPRIHMVDVTVNTENSADFLSIRKYPIYRLIVSMTISNTRNQFSFRHQ